MRDIAEMLEEGKGGRLSAALARLAESGFVSDDAGKNPETGADIREKKYRLRDNYARFYLKYVAPVKRVIDCCRTRRACQSAPRLCTRAN